MKIQSLTVQHDPAEDRIVLLARIADAEQILLLTRRLTYGLLGALGKQIQRTQGDQRLAQAGLQDELLSMKHARALNRIRKAQADRLPAVSPAPQRLPTRLLTTIEIRDQGQGRQLVFSDTQGEIASIALDAAQLHWFVGRLATHSRNAGWDKPIPVPGWLEQNTNAEPTVSQQPSRSVH
jgi:hypothetical protein